jgi:aldose 1-epimerase
VDGAVTPGQIRLQAGETTAAVDPAAGGRLTSLVIGGQEIVVQHGSDTFHWGSFPMAPWVGRLRHGRLDVDGRTVQLPVNAGPHALHGLVTEQTWTVTRADEHSAELFVELGHGEDPWPWPCRVQQSVSLAEDRLDFRLSVTSEQPMPADIGWHPWFLRDLTTATGTVSAQLDVCSAQIYLNDADGIPNGELGHAPPPPWDFCFVGLTRPPAVRWPGLLELTVDSDCDHWVLYDREPAGLCLEPWTGPPNSLNWPRANIVTPDDPLEATMLWSWQNLGT